MRTYASYIQQPFTSHQQTVQRHLSTQQINHQNLLVCSILQHYFPTVRIEDAYKCLKEFGSIALYWVLWWDVYRAECGSVVNEQTKTNESSSRGCHRRSNVLVNLFSVTDFGSSLHMIPQIHISKRFQNGLTKIEVNGSSMNSSFRPLPFGRVCMLATRTGVFWAGKSWFRRNKTCKMRLLRAETTPSPQPASKVGPHKTAIVLR